MKTLTIIEAGRAHAGLLREAWDHRELMRLLAWRDVAVRYKQTVLGVAWALLRPLVTMLILVAVFAVIIRVPSPDTPYPLVVLAGLLPWALLSNTITSAAESLLGNSAMLSKVYFPRILLPISAVATPLIDFLVGFVLLVLLMAAYQVTPTWRVLALPGLVALALVLAIGSGIWLAAACVRFRDLRHAVPFALQVGLYASPVAYPTAIVPERWQLVYALNPVVGLIDGFRWALLGVELPNPLSLAISTSAAVAIFALGMAHFRSVERGLVDVL